MTQRKIKINNNCPTHGNNKKAKERFWKNPWTSHWACKCIGNCHDGEFGDDFIKIGRSELIYKKLK